VNYATWNSLDSLRSKRDFDLLVLRRQGILRRESHAQALNDGFKIHLHLNEILPSRLRQNSD